MLGCKVMRQENSPSMSLYPSLHLFERVVSFPRKNCNPNRRSTVHVQTSTIMQAFTKKKKNRERCFTVLSRAWDKEKILSPHEESNLLDVRIPRSDAQPLSHKHSMVSKALYEVHVWHPSCKPLGSTMSICFSMSLARDKTIKYLSLFLYRA